MADISSLTAKLERDGSMSRCRSLSAFLGKRCVADNVQAHDQAQTEDLAISDFRVSKASEKRKSGRFTDTIGSKNKASTAEPVTLTTPVSILKLLSRPPEGENLCVKSFRYGVQAKVTNTKAESLSGDDIVEAREGNPRNPPRCSISVLSTSPREDRSPSPQVNLNRKPSEQINKEQNPGTKYGHLIINNIAELGSVQGILGMIEAIQHSESQKSEVMDGDCVEISGVKQEACPLELSICQEHAGDATLQNPSDLSVHNKEACQEQSKWEHAVGDAKVQDFKEGSVKTGNAQQQAQPQCETACEEEHQFVFAGPKGLQPPHCERLQSVSACLKKVQEKKQGCVEDKPLMVSPANRRKQKKNEVEIHRSSRIKKLSIKGEVDTIVLTRDFFLPASKKCRTQRRPETTNSFISNSTEASKSDVPVLRGKRPREEKLAQSAKGSAGTNSKQSAKNEDFFKPALKKQKQMLNREAVVKFESPTKAEKGDGSSLFHFDLWMEAKLAAEENAQLCAGKPTHPFFSQHKVGQRVLISLGITGDVSTSHQASFLEVEELTPAPPFHITQLPVVEVCKADRQSWNFAGILQEWKSDQSLPKAGCFESSTKELGSVLRIPLLGDLSGTLRGRKQRPQGPSIDNVLEPLVTFLKDHGNKSKDEVTADKDEFVFSLAYLDRLKLCYSDRVRECTGGSSADMTSSDTEAGSSTKNLLWTDVYQPRTPDQICGNTETVRSLNAWLQSWKTRSASAIASSEGNMTHRRIANGEDCDENRGWFEEDSDSDGNPIEDDVLQNVLFLAGPVGCGKTTTIYACARAHGYTVIEVNCSDNRSGLLIKQKFSEAMESHCLGTWSADTTVPADTNTYSIKRSISTEADVHVDNSHATETEKLQHVDKKQSCGNVAAKSDSKISNKRVLPSTNVGLAPEAEQLGENDESTERDKKAMTVLLFEDVDMVFEDDRGFMAAVAQVAVTAKRPIILTSNDKELCLPHSLGAHLLEFKSPSTKELVALAYLVCVVEGITCRPEFLLQMVKVCHHDVRKLLNYLQFWCQGQRFARSSETGNEKENASMVDEKEAGRQSNSRFQKFDSTNLFNLEAQHRLWPAYIPLKFPCEVTMLVACKLNETVFETHKILSSDKEKKLEQEVVKKRKRILLRKLKRRCKVDSPLKEGDSDTYEWEGVNNVGETLTAEASEFLETPVKNLKEAKTVARSPILRRKIRRQLSIMMSDSDTDIPSATHKEQHHQDALQTASKHDNAANDSSIEPVNSNASFRVASIDTGSVIAPSSIEAEKMAASLGVVQIQFERLEELEEASTKATDVETDTLQHTSLTSEASQLEQSQSLTSEHPFGELGSDCGQAAPPGFHSISEPIYNLWSQLRDSKEEYGFLLSSASKESFSTVVSLSNLSDNLSACDIMSCVHGPKHTDLEEDAFTSSCWEDPECGSWLQACAQFAHKSLQVSVQNCCAISSSIDEIRDAVSPKDMMSSIDEIRDAVSPKDMILAMNDPSTLGKLATDEESIYSAGFLLEDVGSSSLEQNLKRLERKSALLHSLSSELPPRAVRSLQGAGFYECASFLARMGHLEQDRLASGSTRRRGRGCQTYFSSHPWNLSDECITILQQYGSFSRP